MKSESGQSTVELALSLTVLILLLFGMIDFGRIFYSYLVLDNAGREAARAASLGENDVEIQQVVQRDTTSLNAVDITVTITPDRSQRTSGTYATVTLGYSIKVLTPIMVVFLTNPYQIQSQTVMRVE